MRHRGATAALAVLALCESAWAEEKKNKDEIVTDRPDVAESSETVGQGRFQAELSTVVETDRAGGYRRTSVRTPLKLRVGVLDHLELHLETDGFARDWGRGPSGELADATGGADLGLGGKVHLFDQRRWLPSTAVLLSLSVPTGTAAFSEEHTSLSPTLALGWDLDDNWSVGVNVGATLALTQRAEHADTLRFAAALWRSWAPVSEQLSSFLEPSGEIPLDGRAPVIQLQGGFAYLFTPHVQLDLAVGVGLTSAAPDFATTLGLSFKI